MFTYGFVRNQGTPKFADWSSALIQMAIFLEAKENTFQTNHVVHG